MFKFLLAFIITYFNYIVSILICDFICLMVLFLFSLVIKNKQYYYLTIKTISTPLFVISNTILYFFIINQFSDILDQPIISRIQGLSFFLILFSLWKLKQKISKAYIEDADLTNYIIAKGFEYSLNLAFLVHIVIIILPNIQIYFKFFHF